jgi:hypothetical protein
MLMKAIRRITVVIALFVTCIHVIRPSMIRNRFGILKVGQRRLAVKLSVIIFALLTI